MREKKTDRGSRSRTSFVLAGWRGGGARDETMTCAAHLFAQSLLQPASPADNYLKALEPATFAGHAIVICLSSGVVPCSSFAPAASSLNDPSIRWILALFAL